MMMVVVTLRGFLKTLHWLTSRELVLVLNEVILIRSFAVLVHHVIIKHGENDTVELQPKTLSSSLFIDCFALYIDKFK